MLPIFASLLFAAAASAQNAVYDDSKPVPSSGSSAESAAAVILCVLTIVTGLLFTFFGRRLYRVVIFFAGMYFFALLAFIITVNCEPVDPVTGLSRWGDNREIIMFGISLGAGVLGGILMVFIVPLGLFAVGVLGGLSLSLFCLSWVSSSAIQSEGGRIAFIVCFAVISGVLAVLLQDHVIVIATAIGGSYAVFIGIDVFAQTGFSQAASFILSGHAGSFVITNSGIYGMLVGMVVLAVVGIIVQYLYTGKGYSVSNRTSNNDSKQKLSQA